MKKYKMLIVGMLIFLEITSIFLMYKSSNNKEAILENISLKNNNVISKNSVAIMLEQSDGTYKESASATWPTNMVFNASKSGCIDTNGATIENVLSYANNFVTVTTNKTAYCYMYFDMPTIEDCNDTLSNCVITYADDLWDSTLEDDGYRYVGTNPDNYVCFGYSNAETDCDFTSTTNSDLYAYRII